MTQTTTPVLRAGLAMDDFGPVDGRPPIVLLHGLTFNRKTWGPVVDAVRQLDPQRRVLAVDLPGHGDSPAQPAHDLASVADLLHRALAEAEVDEPVLVGHSMSGPLVSIYASSHPAAAVVNVDQPPEVAPFAALVHRMEGALRGPAFDEVWRTVFYASFGVEQLPADVARLVRETSAPAQQLVLSYWREVLEEPVEEISALMQETCAMIAQRAVPYLLFLGRAAEPAEEQRIRAMLPQLDIVCWPGTGHFPHLVRPAEFARRILDAHR
jgi:pimeloyl-ACP methyl ester carboxylesterase